MITGGLISPKGQCIVPNPWTTDEVNLSSLPSQQLRTLTVLPVRSDTAVNVKAADGWRTKRHVPTKMFLVL